jgi:FKBP-type peptidyl-prolyl cis-trans isomerase
MRRLAHVALAPVLALAPAAAGCSDPGGAGQITVRGSFGRQPDVTIPKAAPGTRLDSSVLHKGTGREVNNGDLVIAHYIGYAWETTRHRRVDNSYTRGHPAPFAVGGRGVIPALAKVLPGKRIGSRVLLVVPPRDGYGPGGFSRLQISGTDTLVFVMDLIAAYPRTAGARGLASQPSDRRLPRVGEAAPGRAPPVTIPKAAPPTEPAAATIVQGTGGPVRAGQLLVFHSKGLIWRNGHVFESSWELRGRPDSVLSGARQMIPGWENAVIGRPVGSRVLAVVPPEYGYGSRGLEQSKIKGSDTLVFVIDIIAAH